MTDRKSIAIIGAGMGGLAAAAILARHGDVTVFERAGQPGGKIRQVAAGGAPVDSGPTVFTMPWLLESVFEQAGTRLDEHVRLTRQPVLARHYWPDGTALDLHADIERSANAIAAQFGPAEADRYRRFCADARAVFDTLDTSFMQAPAPSFLGLLARCSPLDLLRTRPFSTLDRFLRGAFMSPELRQLYGRYATYCGASPFAAPATLMLVAHVEQAGVWALEGGMQALATALEQLARSNGARFVYNTSVREIAVAAGRVQGVRLAEPGQPIGQGTARGPVRPFDMVVMNGDAAALASGALGSDVAAAVPRVAAQRSQSAITWSALAEPVGRPLAFHTVCFSDDYRAEFDAVFARGCVPSRPTVYICAPDRAAGAASPAARTDLPPGAPRAPERMFCLINAPANGDRERYGEKEIAECRTRMEDQLDRCGVRLNLVEGTETVTTPETFAAMFPQTGGALYGMASHGWQASFRRPGVRTRVRGLYLAGGSVHPGPGVPMAALSGRMAAAAMIRDCGLTQRSPEAVIAGGISTPSAQTAPTA